MVEGWPLCVFNALLAYISAAYLINLCSKKKVGTYDPNYQTLANIQGDVFGADKKAAPAPAIKPGGPGMAGTYDPNYQTLANVQGDVFGADKKNAPAGGGGGGGGGAPPPEIKPGAGGMAGTFDPNYQTLAGMNADVFKK
ncbi:hypothetical protein TELCIR_01386 [Teladorsagia circumcincta]|uniref:Uncharacterized protein n=1 Tax=Teladorsagia circumcincta TaxID=45464 RepID=A0A2G9V245_TELCI|nr:hypothetical protein TELCIR_01386 [Teladorsagia circumcincta]